VGSNAGRRMLGGGVEYADLHHDFTRHFAEVPHLDGKTRYLPGPRARALRREQRTGSEWLSHLSDAAVEDYVSGAADADEKTRSRQIAMCGECREKLKDVLRRSA
jgi:hypothetical protein